MPPLCQSSWDCHLPAPRVFRPESTLSGHSNACQPVLEAQIIVLPWSHLRGSKSYFVTRVTQRRHQITYEKNVLTWLIRIFVKSLRWFLEDGWLLELLQRH